MINRRGVYVFSLWCWNFRLLNERWNILVQKKRTYTTCLFPKNLKNHSQNGALYVLRGVKLHTAWTKHQV